METYLLINDAFAAQHRTIHVLTVYTLGLLSRQRYEHIVLFLRDLRCSRVPERIRGFICVYLIDSVLSERW